MNTDRKQINFTIVPDDSADLPADLREFLRDLAHAVRLHAGVLRGAAALRAGHQGRGSRAQVKAPVRAKIVVPLQVVPNLIAALQEHMRVFSESTGGSWDKGPVH